MVFSSFRRIVAAAICLGIPLAGPSASASDSGYNLKAVHVGTDISHPCVEVKNPKTDGIERHAVVGISNNCPDKSKWNGEKKLKVKVKSCQPVDCPADSEFVESSTLLYITASGLGFSDHPDRVEEKDKLDGTLVVTRDGKELGRVDFVARWTHSQQQTSGCSGALYPCC